MGRPAIVDTSVWVSWLRQEPRAFQVLRALAGRPMHVPTLLIAELQSLAAQGRAPLDAPVSAMELSTVEVLDTESAVAAGKLHAGLRLAGRSRLSLADAVSLVTARRLQGTLVTFDRDLQGEPDVEVL